MPKLNMNPHLFHSPRLKRKINSDRRSDANTEESKNNTSAPYIKRKRNGTTGQRKRAHGIFYKNDHKCVKKSQFQSDEEKASAYTRFSERSDTGEERLGGEGAGT